jgi:hypothetical protein
MLNVNYIIIAILLRFFKLFYINTESRLSSAAFVE